MPFRRLPLELRSFFLILLVLGFSFQVRSQAKIWTLKDCIQTALEKNIALNQSQLNNEITRITWDQSKYN
ncbi:MAG TPA: hypothetical protein VNZ86_00890, partial [Bacteroidia bacterium]|nr:hypothetical protein [Bacteroidia bacterium]